MHEKNNIDTKLVTKSKWFNDLDLGPRFKQCYQIDEIKLIVKLSSDEIELKYTVFVDW